MADSEAPAEQHKDALLRSAERKLSLRVFPALSMLSIICYLDRANLAFASVEMNADLGFSTATYGLGSGLFFVGYALCQVPSNMILTRVGGPLWLSIICCVWGLVAGCFAAVNSRGGFLTLRLLLGIAEAGALPGMWYYVSLFYLPPRLTIPMSLVMVGITVAQVIGAPMAAGFLAMHGAGGLAGWRWLFIMEAIPAVLLGLCLWWVLPNSIADAHFLTPEERDVLSSEMALYQAVPSGTADASASEPPAAAPKGSPGEGGSKAGGSTTAAAPRRRLADDWESLKEALRCVIVWCGGTWRMLYAMAVYGLQYFTPLIIHTITPGTSNVNVTLLSAVPFAAAAIFHMTNAWHSQRTGERRLHIALPWLVGGIFMAVLPTVTEQGKTVAAMAVLTCASMGVNGSDGPDVSWITSLMTHEVLLVFSAEEMWERLLGLPFLNMLANVGGFVGPYLIGALNTASGNYDSSEWVMAGCILSAALLVLAFPLRWSGAWRAQQQQQLAAAASGHSAAAASEGASQWGPSRRASHRLLPAMSCGEVMLACPAPVRSQLLPELDRLERTMLQRRAASHVWAGGLITLPSGWGAAADAAEKMERAATS